MVRASAESTGLRMMGDIVVFGVEITGPGFFVAGSSLEKGALRSREVDSTGGVRTDIFRPADDDGLDVYDGRVMKKTRRRDETSKLPSHISQARARPPRLPNNSPFPHESFS